MPRLRPAVVRLLRGFLDRSDGEGEGLFIVVVDT